MASVISDKTEISPKAKIGNNCKIFPFVYIEDDVEIGDNCIIFPFVSICDGSRIGRNNKIHQGAVIAALPQDFNFRGAKSYVEIGDNNVIRENVVINRGSSQGSKTVIGSSNFLFEGTHISHDTVIGDHCVFGYGVKIAGDCEIHNGAIFSSSVVQNAKTRVGEGAMIQAGTTFSKDVPPYIICTKKNTYGGVNFTMGRFYGVDEKTMKHIANAYRLVFHGQTSLFDAVNQIEQQVPDSAQIRHIIEFLRSSQIGVISKL
jgi:UDP-N-acetylglucosamine acyltransferase